MFSESAALDEVRRCHDLGRTGVLPLSTEAGEGIEVVFREGTIEAVAITTALNGSFLSARRLGHYLVENASVSKQDLIAIQSEARRRKVPFGEAAVRRGFVEEAGVAILVRHQAVDLLEFAFGHPMTVMEFATQVRSYKIPARLSLHQLLLELARRDPSVIDVGPDDRFCLASREGIASFPWYPQELSVLLELRSPRAFSDLVEATRLDTLPVTRVLSVLERLGLIHRADRTSDQVGAPDHVGEALTTGRYGALAANGETSVLEFVPSVSSVKLDEKLEVVNSGSSFTSEQFRTLKVQIGEADSEHLRKVFTVSSPEARDGKSLVSAGLALSFAMEPHRRVVIVDCDLRNPAVARYFGVPTEPGLVQYLTNGSLQPSCYLKRLDNLFLMTAGGVAPNPIELLSMGKMRRLIEYLQSEFDTIILDAPPYSPIADARLVTGLSDGLILVLRRGKSSYTSTDRALRAIDRNKLIGAVFNDVKPMLFHTYERYGYYRYGHDYEYSTKSHLKAPRKPKSYLES